MNEQDDDARRDSRLRAGLEDWMEEARRHRGPHPTAEEIAAYYEQRLAPAAAEQLQDHLLACPGCTALLADLDGWVEGTVEVPDLSAAQIAAGWQELLPRLDAERPAEAAGPVREAAPAVPAAGRRRRAVDRRQLLAAVLALAVVGLSGWVAALRRELARPELNAPVLDLYPEGLLRRGGTGVDAAVPPAARLFTLILTPPPARRHRLYEVDVVRAGGGGDAEEAARAKGAAGARPVVWSGRGLVPNTFGSLSLTLPRQALGAGTFEIRLFGRDAGQRELVTRYRLTVAER